MTAAGLYLVMRLRTFPVILGMSLLTYAVNVFLFASGRLTIGSAPILRDGVEVYADPLPQALVLTAIVISFSLCWPRAIILAFSGCSPWSVFWH